MKHLNLFKTETEYNQFKDSEDYVLPNVSYVEETGEIGFNPYIEPASPNLVATFNVEDISGETCIAGQYSGKYFTSMIVDGIEMDVDSYYQFDTTGKHTVEFVLADNTSLGFDLFNNTSGLISVEIPSTVTLISASAFSGRRDLKEIICYSNVAPTIEGGVWVNNVEYTGVLLLDAYNGVVRHPKGSDYSSWFVADNGTGLLGHNWTTKEF